MSDFKAAMPLPGSWSVENNRFDEEGRNPKRLSLFIPLDSIPAFAQYVMAAGDDTARHKEGKTYDYNSKENVKVPGVYLNFNGTDGDYGPLGRINPRAIEPNPNDAF